MPRIVDAVRARATVGEISDVLARSTGDCIGRRLRRLSARSVTALAVQSTRGPISCLRRLSLTSMPTYEFRCPIGHEFEQFYRSIGTAEPSRLPRVRADGRAASCRRARASCSRVPGSTSPTTARTRIRSEGQCDAEAAEGAKAGAAAQSPSAKSGESGGSIHPSRRAESKATNRSRATPSAAESKPAASSEAERQRVSTRRRDPARRAHARGAQPRRARRRRARARASARSGVRRLGDQPRDGAREAARPEAARPRGAADRARSIARAAGISSAEVAGPGFINFRMDAGARRAGARRARRRGR